MSDPRADVEQAIRTALATLDAAPDGWLDLPDRRRLRAAFGPWTPPGQPGGPDAGLFRRAALQVACARRALPRWEESFPTDRRPHELVDSVLPALRGEIPEAQVEAVAEALRGEVEDLGAGGPRAAFFAGTAAVGLTYEAWDGDLDPEIYEPERRDREMDEPRVEAAAAWALAFEDPDGLRAYWRWYVTEAFPAAYRVTA